MSYRARFTEEARADLLRLTLECTDGDWSAAERVIEAIEHALILLQTTPFSCRKAFGTDALLRELIIPFGATGYVALFDIDSADTVTILAVRHQREDDYY